MTAFMAAGPFGSGCRGYFRGTKSQRSKTGKRRLFWSKAACIGVVFQRIVCNMELPGQPVTLTVEQIGELNQKLSTLRHDVNNNLSLIMAAVEVIQFKPHLADRMMTTVTEQPPKIMQAVAKFSAEFEQLLGIKR